MRSSLSFPAKRELLVQTAHRYQTASHSQKSIILNEFVAATGYARKYAIRLLTNPVPPVVAIKRPRERHYGPVIQEALIRRLACRQRYLRQASGPLPRSARSDPREARPSHLDR